MQTVTRPLAQHAQGVTAGAAIASVACALPPTVVDNAEIAARLGVDERWIVERTGIRSRRMVQPDDRIVDLAAEAGARALEGAGVEAAELDLVLVATTTPDELMPNAAPLVATALGAGSAAAADIGAACTGFLCAFALGVGYVEASRARAALVIGADALSRFLDPDDRPTAALFGDGAGAVVIASTSAPGRVGPIAMGCDGCRAHLLYIRRDEAKIRMQGPETFKHAVDRMSEATLEALALAGLGLDDIDLFVFHQANARVLRAVGERLGLPPARLADYIDRFGNTSAASIPIALAMAVEDGRLAAGDRVLIGAFGAGFTWGAAVVSWGRDGT